MKAFTILSCKVMCFYCFCWGQTYLNHHLWWQLKRHDFLRSCNRSRDNSSHLSSFRSFNAIYKTSQPWQQKSQTGRCLSSIHYLRCAKVETFTSLTASWTPTSLFTFDRNCLNFSLGNIGHCSLLTKAKVRFLALIGAVLVIYTTLS